MIVFESDKQEEFLVSNRYRSQQLVKSSLKQLLNKYQLCLKLLGNIQRFLLTGLTYYMHLLFRMEMEPQLIVLWKNLGITGVNLNVWQDLQITYMAKMMVSFFSVIVLNNKNPKINIFIINKWLSFIEIKLSYKFIIYLIQINSK